MIFLRRPLKPQQMLHLTRINNRGVCLSKCKKSPACTNLRRPGFHSHIGLNSGVFVGGGLSCIFFPPACFKHVDPSHIVGDIPPLEEPRLPTV